MAKTDKKTYWLFLVIKSWRLHHGLCQGHPHHDFINCNIRYTLAHACLWRQLRREWFISDKCENSTITCQFSLAKRKAHLFSHSPVYAGDIYKANLPSGFRDTQWSSPKHPASCPDWLWPVAWGTLMWRETLTFYLQRYERDAIVFKEKLRFKRVENACPQGKEIKLSSSWLQFLSWPQVPIKTARTPLRPKWL